MTIGGTKEALLESGTAQDNGNFVPISPEIILGQFEHAPFLPQQLIMLAQIRGERNVVTKELKEDILYQGLLNPVDVSLLSEKLMREYIEFTNATWGSDARIEDFEDQCLLDGRYPLLKSGHSRLTAILENIAEGKLPENTQVMTRLSEVHSVQQIVDWQRGENIHSQPPRERTAMALVESFMYGLQTGQWQDEKDFIAQQKELGRDVSKSALGKALKYAALPARIRNFVLSGNVPYLAGVELGATVDTIREFCARNAGYDGLSDMTLTDENRQQIEDLAVVELDILCTKITNGRLNSTASQKMIQGYRNEWHRLIATMRGDKGESQTLEFTFADDQLGRQLHERTKLLMTELQELRRRYNGSDVVLFLQQQTGVIPDEDVNRLIGAFNASVTTTRAKLGASATSSSIDAVPQDTSLF